MTAADMDTALIPVVARCVEDFEEITRCERLTGGASQETWQLRVRAAGAERKLALRRNAHQRCSEEPVAGLGLAVEALLIRAADKAGIPAPVILTELKVDDELGEGFIMQWLEGEALGPVARLEGKIELPPGRQFANQDAWGNPYLYWCAEKTYVLLSHGADGKPGSSYDGLPALGKVGDKPAAMQLVGILGLTHNIYRTFGWACRLAFGKIQRVIEPPDSRIPMRNVTGGKADHELKVVTLTVERPVEHATSV